MRIAIVGAGGHATVVADILLRMRDAGAQVEPIACVDERPHSQPRTILSLRVIDGGLDALRTIGCDAVIVAVRDNRVRRRISEQLRQGGLLLAIARHPFSMVAPDVDLGPGVVICAGAVVNPSTRIGSSAIVNTNASIDHDNAIGDFVHIAPGVHLGGAVTVGDDTLVGIGATVLPHLTIGRRAVVGAGAVVTRSVPDDMLAIGVPARIEGKAAAVIAPPGTMTGRPA
jgi:sugar O-acyltransferase (sialic acid O-acetyltransferase NeuD family)